MSDLLDRAAMARIPLQFRECTCACLLFVRAGKDLDYKTSLRSLLVARLPDSCKSGNALQDEPDLPLPESLLQCHLDTPEVSMLVLP